MTGLRARLRDRFHEARADLFVDRMGPSAGARLLDLGGGDGSLSARISRRVPLEVVVADAVDHHRDTVRGRGFGHVLVEPGAPLPFRPGDFDLVLCNSVIEHATLPKERCSVQERIPHDRWVREARAAQQEFADRIRALDAPYFVQTPHRHFPIEAHVQLPFVQYLTHNGLCRLVRWTDRFWIKSCQGCVDWELVTPRVMTRMFPDATVTVERLGGLPKSIVAWTRG